MISVIISLNILVMHVTKIIFSSFFTRLDMLITIGIRYYNHRDRHARYIFGIENVMIQKKFSFHSKDQG